MRRLLVIALILVTGSTASAQNGPLLGYYPPATVGHIFEAGTNTIGVANGGTAGVPNPQSFAVFNFCDGVACVTGSQSLRLGFSSNGADISSEATGTGTAGTIFFGIAGTRKVQLLAYQFAPFAVGTMDLGFSGRPWKHIYVDSGLIGGKTKALTDGAAAVVAVRLGVASNSYTGGELLWGATSTDATDYRMLTGRIKFSFTNKGGTEECTDVAVVGTDLLSSSNANALACTWSGASAAADTCDLLVTCTDDTAAAQTVAVWFRPDIIVPMTLSVSFP